MFKFLLEITVLSREIKKSQLISISSDVDLLLRPVWPIFSSNRRQQLIAGVCLTNGNYQDSAEPKVGDYCYFCIKLLKT
jgi:hypothetical protein